MSVRAVIAAVLVVVLASTSLPALSVAQAPPPPAPPTRPEPTGDEVAGSVASNFFYAPGKFFTCLGGSVLWVATMAITFGTMYDDAARVFHGACGGKWTLDDADMRQALEPAPPQQR